MNTNETVSIDTEKIKYAVARGIPISITTYTLPQSTKVYITDVARIFLQLLNKESIEKYIVFCLNELTANAQKANTKRIYFSEKGLDIQNLQDYKNGIKSFKNESLCNLDYYLSKQKEAGLYTKVLMFIKNNTLVFEVRNNVEMVTWERSRIFERLTLARKYDNTDEAFLHVVDTTEGAGLGLILMMLMMKKIGLSENAYQLESNSGITVSRILIPLEFEVTRYVAELAKTIVDYIQNIPQFPETITEIQSKINDPDVTVTTVASIISGDIALTVDLLKLVNSAHFTLTKKCLNIEDAVKFIGLRGVQNLIYSVGVLQVLPGSNNEQIELWNYTYKCAFFAHMLAKKYSKIAILEDVYVCALLHNLGKIVFSSLYPELIQKIHKVQIEKDIPPEVFQRIMGGMEHHIIGTAVAEKWNFPQEIINTIKYQNNPEDAPEAFFELVAMVAFSHFLVQFGEGLITFKQIPKLLCRHYRIDEEETLRSLYTGIAHQFIKK